MIEQYIESAISTERIMNKQTPVLARLVCLYEISFPESERTSTEHFLNMIEQCPQMSLYAVQYGEETAGFYCIWDLNECYYLLYLVTVPHLRNRHIGRQILKYLNVTLNKPLFLEADIPVDDISVRRANYYKRNGFFVIANNPQTLYAVREPSCKLLLMCNRTIDNPEPYMIKIRDIVYEAMGNGEAS